MAGPDVRVCFLGDSFTLGTGDVTGLGWPGRVIAAARGRGTDLSGYNLGIRGETGAQIARRTAAEVDVRIDERGGRRGVVVSFGANDIFQGRPIEESVQAAADILGWARGKRYRTFMMGAPHAPEPEMDAQRGQLNLSLEQVAESFEVPFLDVRAIVPDWTAWHTEAFEGDGGHPSGGGYSLVAEAFDGWKPWRDWLDG